MPFLILILLQEGQDIKPCLICLSKSFVFSNHPSKDRLQSLQTRLNTIILLILFFLLFFNIKINLSSKFNSKIIEFFKK